MPSLIIKQRARKTKQTKISKWGRATAKAISPRGLKELLLQKDNVREIGANDTLTTKVITNDAVTNMIHLRSRFFLDSYSFCRIFFEQYFLCLSLFYFFLFLLTFFSSLPFAPSFFFSPPPPPPPTPSVFLQDCCKLGLLLRKYVMVINSLSTKVKN